MTKLSSTPTPPAILEQWYRDLPPHSYRDLSSSGVAPYTFRDVCELGGLRLEALQDLVLGDSTSFGGVGIRSATAQRFAGGDVERVMMTAGSSEALFLCLTTLLGPEDEVVVPSPAYHSLRTVPRLAGARVRTWDLGTNGDFGVDLDSLAALLSPRTRCLIVNFPSNPTGVSVTPEEMDAIRDLAAEARAYLVWDAAFSELLYEPDEMPVLDRENEITVGTLSKAYGFPGLRVGWCIASPELLSRTLGLHDVTTLFVSSLVEFVAEHVIVNADRFRAPRLAVAARNREWLRQWVSINGDLARWTIPDGGVSGFLYLPTVADVWSFCAQLAERSRVLLVPGAAFGEPDHVRLGFGVAEEHTFDNAMALFVDALDETR
jgi:capreomycidine synthase